MLASLLSMSLCACKPAEEQSVAKPFETADVQALVEAGAFSEELETLDADAVDYMSAGDWDLTLFTCTYGGQSRVTIRCEEIG